MTRSYIKFDPLFPDRKDYYPDGPWRALVETFCYAGHQERPGRFKNERVLRALLGPRGKHVPFLIEQGDLTPSNLGYLYVEGWDEWQEGKYPSVAARVAAIESRRGPMSPAERTFLYRQRKKDRDGSRDGGRDTSRNAGVEPHRVPDPTRPDDTTTENGSIEEGRRLPFQLDSKRGAA